MEDEFDIVVIGSGAGGGTLASVCAAAGRRVLLAERGDDLTRSEASEPSARAVHDEYETLIRKKPYDDREISLTSGPRHLYMGGILGGGTSVYGGALIRPLPEDFSPGSFYKDRLPREIHRWPVEFGEMEPLFEVAERLYQVSSSLPLARINQRLMQTANSAGLQPYPLPLAIDASRCLRCDHCAGFVCPTGARRSSSQLVQESIQRGDSLTLKTRWEADRLQRGTGGRLEGVWFRDRRDGSQRIVRAKRYVLSAGAIGSPALLLRSGFDHPLIGRNYMMHYSPVVIGLFGRDTGASHTFIKQVGLSDFYFGTADLREKMGIVQSLPAPGPRMMGKLGLKHVPEVLLRFLRARMLPLVGIVEDLPDPANRVSITDSGAVSLRHQFSDFDRWRGKNLSVEMRRLLRKAGAWYCASGRTPSAEHVAHQCGTLRFGTSSKHAVADPECRLFGQPDVFIADGSFMPSSLGVGPSLTIIANAVRVARILVSEL